MPVAYGLAYGLQKPCVHSRVVHIPEYGHKFVATQASHNIVAANARQQILGNGFQHRVTHRVAVLVIDFLETVQIDKADRNQTPALIGFKQFLFKQRCQPAPVGQSGKSVEVGRLLKTLLVFVLFLVEPFALDEVANGLQQRFKLFGEPRGVTVQPVGQSDKANLFVARKHRNTDVSADRWMTTRQAAAAGV